MGIHPPSCQLLRHEASLEIFQQAGKFSYFVDLTENHYKALISLSLSNGSLQEIVGAQFIVTPRTGPSVAIDIPTSRQVRTAIQVEDAVSVALNYNGPSVTGTMTIVKDFCICCQNCDLQRHESTYDYDDIFTFTDVTENHYKALVLIDDTQGNEPGPTGEIIVTPRVGASTTIPLPPQGQIFVQIEDAASVSIDADLPGTIRFIKDFCICCP